jgi:type I restriction enzyme M protein
MRQGIFMIDASSGYMKDGPKNRLRAQDIHKIVDVFTRQLDIPQYSRLVSFAEIEQNEFNLNLPRYIDSQEPEDIQDIAGHLCGGIPTCDIAALESYWCVLPGLKSALVHPLRDAYSQLSILHSQLKQTIYAHPEFVAFTERMNTLFAAWRQKSAATLKALQAGFHPKEVSAVLAEDLLAHYAGKPLIDKYDVYQHLLDYWAETMQDDCYLIAADGWKAETYRIIEKDKKGKEKDKGWACDLVPKALIVACYFATEQEAITQLEAELESITARVSELEEEHGGEEGGFSALEKVNKASVSARLKEIRGLFATDDEETREEAAVLDEWLKLSNQEVGLKKKLKDAEAALDAKAYAQYPKLTEDDVKTLVVDDKWLAALDAAIHEEMERISQALTQRVKELAERYETPMPQMGSRVAELEAKVNRHLERMGFSMNGEWKMGPRSRRRPPWLDDNPRLSEA